MAQIPTTPANIKRIEDTANKLMDLMITLSMRWRDEKGHEDIAEYGKRIAKDLPKGFTLQKMSKRPFGFVFDIGTDATYMIYVSGNQYGWKRLG